jgi:hypothetical protein
MELRLMVACHYTPEGKQAEIFKNNIDSVLIGLLLGDGYITHNHGRLVAFRFTQSIIHVAYFSYVFLILIDYLTKGSPSLKGCYAGEGEKQKWHWGWILAISVKFNTILQIENLNNMFYSKIGKMWIKVIPSNIASLMNPIVLAFWIMDDGHFTGSGLLLNTQSFNAYSIGLLVNALNSTFGINCTLRKVTTDQNKIYISAKDYKKIIPLIEPYFTPSMYYKLGK